MRHALLKRTRNRRRAIRSHPGPAPPSHLYLSLLGLRHMEPAALVGRIAQGLPFQALVRLQENTLLSARDIADLVAIPPRTLNRRKTEGRLDPEESDRLVRVARVYAKALALFEGDGAAARTWFNAPVRALGNERPIRLARTDPGSREVEALIDRLEQGVLA